jgi:hypothetical protein
VLSTRAATYVAGLIAATMLLTLTFSTQAGAKAGRAVAGRALCTHSAASHTTHGAHSCAEGAGKGHRKGKAHTHIKTGGQHHGAGTQTPTGGGPTEGSQVGGEAGKEAANGGEGPSAQEARCADGSAPEAVEAGENRSEEAFVCEDGSEPACANGLAPVVSGDGLQLLCEATTSEKRSS